MIQRESDFDRRESADLMNRIAASACTVQPTMHESARMTMQLEPWRERARKKWLHPCLAALLAAILAVPLPAFRPQPVYARNAMVVTAERHATEIGVDVLRDGGNAVDAAVAIGLALAVTEPNAGNLGGGGFMLIRLADGRSTFLDFREMAPGSAHREMYLDDHGRPTRDSVTGYRASGVPGTVRGLALALKK